MRKIFLFLIFSIYSYALTPYSLENLKEVNIKFFNKKETISKELEEKITKKIEGELNKLGVKTKTDNYSNFILRVKINKFEEVTFVRTSLFIIEDIKPIRDEDIETIAITYQISDEFEAEELELEIYESFVDYLFEDFKEQYKAEN